MKNSIVSISLNPKLLGDIDKLQEELGFSGRSEMIRSGLRLLMEDKKEKEKLSGKLTGAIIVIHREEYEDVITENKHIFEKIIKTHIHNNIGDDKCLEVFLIEGEAEKIKQILKSFETNKKIEFVKLIVS